MTGKTIVPGEPVTLSWVVCNGANTTRKVQFTSQVHLQNAILPDNQSDLENRYYVIPPQSIVRDSPTYITPSSILPETPFQYWRKFACNGSYGSHLETLDGR